MHRTIQITETCAYCSQSFYLPSDLEEHVKVAHFDFGTLMLSNLEGDALDELLLELTLRTRQPSDSCRQA